jgi:hypothetical protein
VGRGGRIECAGDVGAAVASVAYLAYLQKIEDEIVERLESL